MSNNKTNLFHTLTPQDIQSIIFLAYSAGVEIGKAKEKTSNLMSDVGRGVFGMMNGRDANHLIGAIGDNNPDIINKMSSFGMKLIADLCNQYNCNNFLK